MKRNRHPDLTPDLAHVPNALSAFLLRPDRPLPYGWWARFRDRWDGRRDRGRRAGAGTTGEVPVADTPWLRRLCAECHNAIAQERTRTEALVSVLDRDIAALSEQVVIAEAADALLAGDLQQVDAEPVTDAVVGAGEMYSPASERVQRRQLERSAAAARLRQQAAAAQEARRAAAQQLRIVTQERQSHWTLLQERSRVLVEHYQRRAATYTRALERRRRGQYLEVPVLDVPEWSSADLGAGGRITEPPPQLRKSAAAL